MAKPALGKGLGELLHGTGAPAPKAATETHTAAAPRLSAGLSTLVRRPGEPSAPAVHAPSLTVVRVALLTADVALTGGAVLHFLSRPTTDGLTTALVLLAVVLGGWLGWLGLTWGRDARG